MTDPEATDLAVTDLAATDLAVRGLFDDKAAAWPSKYAPGGRLAARLAQLTGAVTRHVPPEGRVLDLGCGTGELAVTLAAAGMRVAGCDISPQMLRRAAASTAGVPAGDVSWVRLDPGWQTLPFEAWSFDAVVASSVLEYTADPAAVLRECGRVLRPGGTVLCSVPDPSHPVRWLEWLLAWAARPPLTTMTWRWPRLSRYLAYLHVSRHRHRARWWHAVAARCGLDVSEPLPGEAQRAPLLLLTLQASADAHDPMMRR
jgi:SAM-dependent methyltransferase